MAERALGDDETAADPVRVTAPDGILVLDGHHPVVPRLVEGVDDPSPVDLAESRDRGSATSRSPTATGRPPGRRRRSGCGRRRRPRRPSPARAAPGRAWPRSASTGSIPSHDEVRRVEVEVEPEPGQPVPQLGRVREVRRVAVRGATPPSGSSPRRAGRRAAAAYSTSGGSTFSASRRLSRDRQRHVAPDEGARRGRTPSSCAASMQRRRWSWVASRVAGSWWRLFS